MLKFTGRFVMVLLAACLTALALYAVVQTNTDALGLNGFPGEGERRQFSGGQNGAANEAAAEGAMPPSGFGEGRGEGRGEHGGEAGSILGLAGVLKNLIVIAIMTLAVSAIQKVYATFFKRRRAQPA